MGNCFASNSSHSPHSSHSSSPSSTRPPDRTTQMPTRNRSFEVPRGPVKRKRYLMAPHGILGTPTDDVVEHYYLGKELGRGQFGVIRQCTDKDTGKLYACKSLSKMKLISQQEVEDVRREIEIMSHLSGHPNVVGLKDVYEDKAFVHIVMELCDGGELFDRIVKRHFYPEKEAALLIKSLVEVIKYCHDMGVMHRDLKPENILLATTSPSSPIKLADFGLALRFAPGQRFSGMAGSAYYIAPEVLNGYYSHEVDLWSIGVILYVLLSGVPPFWGETEQAIFEAINEGTIDFESDPWTQISSSAKHLIRRLLCPDPKVRLTPEQVLQHPWILRHTLEHAIGQRKGTARQMREENTRYSTAEAMEETAAVIPGRIGVSEEIAAAYQHQRLSEVFSFKNSTLVRGCISNLPLQTILPDAGLDVGEDFSIVLETATSPFTQCLDLSPASHVASTADPAVVLRYLSSISSTGQDSSNPESSYDRSSSSSSFTSQSTCQDNFERWASFSQVAEPTYSEFLAAVISSLESTHLPYPRDWTQVRVRDGCTCTILRASKKKQLAIVNVTKGKFLVLYDRERKRIGWKHLEAEDDAAMLDSSALCWASCPVSPLIQQTQLAF